MLKVKSRPECAQETAAPVTVEDQIDAALAPSVRTSSTVARAMAAYYPTFREAEDDERSTPEVKARRSAASNQMDAVWAEYEAGPLPIQAPAGILSELMAVVSRMASSFGAHGFGITESFTAMERLWRIIRPASEILGIDPDEIGADALSLSIDEGMRSETYYARCVVMRALEQGIAFRLTPGGKLEIFRREGDQVPEDRLANVSEEDLAEEVKRLIAEKGGTLTVPANPAHLAGQTWWLTRDDMRNTPRDRRRMSAASAAGWKSGPTQRGMNSRKAANREIPVTPPPVNGTDAVPWLAYRPQERLETLRTVLEVKKEEG